MDASENQSCKTKLHCQSGGTGKSKATDRCAYCQQECWSHKLEHLNDDFDELM